MFNTILFMDLRMNRNYNDTAGSTHEQYKIKINNLKTNQHLFSVIINHSNNIPIDKNNFYHTEPYYSLNNKSNIFNNRWNHMFCTTDNNIPKYIYNYYQCIFYKSHYIFHMNELSNFYNILKMDSLIRMMIFLLDNKKIVSHKIHIHINQFLHMLSRSGDKANK